MGRITRVLIAKVGLDEHTWGARAIANSLREKGMEIIYMEMVTPEEIAEAAVQEDVDVVGISMHSGAHLVLLPKIAKLLAEKGERRFLIIAGGIIPFGDVPGLKEAGIAEVFPPGTLAVKISDFIEANIRANDMSEEGAG